MGNLRVKRTACDHLVPSGCQFLSAPVFPSAQLEEGHILPDPKAVIIK